MVVIVVSVSGCWSPTSGWVPRGESPMRSLMERR